MRKVAGAMPKLHVLPTIRSLVAKWMVIEVPTYAQNPPVPLREPMQEEARVVNDDVTLVLGCMSVRGGLYDAYLEDRKQNPSQLPMVQRGYFARVFKWNFSKEFQDEHENPIVVDKVVSSTGYCKICTKNAVLISSGDLRDRRKGLSLQQAHRRAVRRQRQGYQEKKDLARTGEVASVGYDGAGTNGFIAPIMRHVEAKLVGNPRVQLKVTGVMHHHRDECERSRNYVVSPPWVQADANLQATMLFYVTLPGIVEDFNQRGMAVPQRLCLRHDGGGDVDNKVHMAVCYYLVKMGAFAEIDDGRAGAGHSHDDFDWAFMVLLRHLKKRPGHGGMTLELLKRAISDMPDATVQILDQAFDFISWFEGCVFRKLKDAREALGKRYRLVDGAVQVEVCPDPTAPGSEYVVIGKGESGTEESFFEKDPKEGPNLAPAWHRNFASATSAETKFRSAIANIKKQVPALNSSLLERCRVPGNSAAEKQQHVVGAWERYAEQRPPVGGHLKEPETALEWPPPCFEMLRANRELYEGGRAPKPAPTPPPTEEPQRKRRRTTSNVKSVQSKQDRLNASERALKQPEPIKIGDFHFALDEHGGTLLWIVKIVKVFKSDMSNKASGSTTPTLLPGWKRTDHHCKCAAKDLNGWYIVDRCTKRTCPRSSSCNVKWYAPKVASLTGGSEAWTAASKFRDGLADFNPSYVTDHFSPRRDCPNSTLLMDCMGPLAHVSTSGKGAKLKIKLKAKGKKEYVATLAQLCSANHPCFHKPEAASTVANGEPGPDSDSDSETDSDSNSDDDYESDDNSESEDEDEVESDDDNC
jgi:hypothetical protein